MDMQEEVPDWISKGYVKSVILNRLKSQAHMDVFLDFRCIVPPEIWAECWAECANKALREPDGGRVVRDRATQINEGCKITGVTEARFTQ